jgi:4-amino-4-deoxy-L-arabinose transferase-like glycosyltransferase
MRGYVDMRLDLAKLERRELCVQGSLLAISVIAVVAWVLLKPIVFTYDTFTYMEVAREFASRKSTNSFYFRLPIYPALLWAFHITDLSHSVFRLIMFQSCLAVASVLLFYLSARLLKPRGAFIVSLVFVLSLLPFVNVKYIMTEQTFLFETMLALYGLIAYLMARSRRDSLRAIVILAVGAGLMMLTRPQGAFVGPVLLFLTAVLAWRRAWIPAMGFLLLIALVWSVQAVDHRTRSGSWNSAGNFENTHTVGKQLFFTFYLEAPSVVNIRVSPENGPATAELKRLLLEEAVKPDNSARKQGYLGNVAPDRLPAYVAGIFDGPDSNLYWTAFYGLDERLGLAGADQLLLRVSLEAARAYPLQTIWLFLQKTFDVYFNPLELPVPLHGQFPAGAFQPPLSEEIARAGDFTNATQFDWAVDRNARWMMRAVMLAAILTLPIALRYPTWRVTVALLVFGLYLNTPIILGTMPLFRYALYAIPVNLMCAFLGIACLISARWPLRFGLYSKVGDGMKR